MTEDFPDDDRMTFCRKTINWGVTKSSYGGVTEGSYRGKVGVTGGSYGVSNRR